MPFIKVLFEDVLNRSMSPAGRDPLEIIPLVLDTDSILYAHPYFGRGPEARMLVKLIDGTELIIQGTPDLLLEQ